MVRRFGILAALLLLPSGLLAASNAQADVATPRQVWLQPMITQGSSLNVAHIQRMVQSAADWADAISDGRWQVAWAGARPALRVSDSSCDTLVHEVARDRQQRSGDASITLYVGDARDCPYRGLAQTPGSWVVVPHVTQQHSAWTRTIAHELGHTFGLQHAGAQTCALLADSPARRSTRCTVDEYGDRTDPMGRGSLDWSLGPLARASLGWTVLDDVSGDGDHEVVLPPEQAVTVTDPATGVEYVVAHRVPGPGAAERSRGVHVYRLPSSAERDVMSVHLPWVRSLSDPWGGRAGMGFIAPSRAVAIDVLSFSSAEARVRITIDSRAALQDRLGPAFIGAQPRLSGDGRLRIPRAMDQSGVVAYIVKVDGRIAERRTASTGVDVWTLRLPLSVDGRASVSVEVTDAAGNTTLAVVR